MNKFSKFFPNDEVRLVVYSREPHYKLFFYLLLIILIFFLLFPLWRLGHYGVLLWITALLLCLVFLANHLLKRNTIYVITKEKIWHVFYVNDQNIKLRGAINLDAIKTLEWHDSDLLITTNQELHILKGLKKTEELVIFFKDLLLSKYDKSGII